MDPGRSRSRGIKRRSTAAIFAAVQSGKAAVMVLGILCSDAAAQLPAARLDALFPPGARAGTEIEVTLRGADLDEVKELHFSHAGCKASHIEGAKFKLALDASVPSGLYEVRASGRYGISTSAIFVAGTLPEITEPANNHTRSAAAALTLPVTINGTVDADASDFFQFSVAKNQSVRLDCAAQRIDSPLNATMSICDNAGRELERAQSTLDRDPALTFAAPADGEYTVELHDIAWRGGATHHYRITVSSPQESPALAPPLPLAGAVLELHAATTEEKEPNDADSAAQTLAIPADVSGKLDDDWFVFTGPKGQVVILDVVSHRLGEPSDPFIAVRKITRDAQGKEQSSNAGEFDDTPAPAGCERFRPGTLDPSGRIVCEEGAAYRVFVGDRFQTGARYRLLLREPKPDFSLLAMPESPAIDGKNALRCTPLLRRNGSAAVSVAVLRRDGFEELVTLHVEGLPAGVTASDTMVPPGISAGVIVLRAAADAKPWTGRLQITGQAGDRARRAREVTPRWNVGDSNAERVDLRLSAEGFMLAVTDVQAAPLSVVAAESRVYESSLAGNIEVPVKFLRDASHKGFKGEWEASLYGLPGQRQWRPVKPAGDAADAKISLSLARRDGNQFTPGTWNVYAATRGTVNWQPEEKTPARELRDSAFSAPIQVKIEPSPVFLTLPAEVAVAPGAKAECIVKLERRYGFAEGVELALRAPDGVKSLTAAKVSAPKEAAEAKLIIECAAATAPGKHACTVEAKCGWNGEELLTRREIVVEIKP